MKKILMLILVIFSMFMFGCDKVESFEEEYADACKANEEAYNHYMKNEDRFLKGGAGPKIDIYYGKYDDVYIVDTNKGKAHLSVVYIKLGLYSFYFSSGASTPLAIYKNRYYDLEEAYEKGYLKNKEVKEFWELWKKYEDFSLKFDGYYLQTLNAYYNRFLKDVEGATYKDVEIIDLMDVRYFEKPIQAIGKITSDYIDNKKIDKVEMVGPFEFKYKYTNDIIYVMADNILYTLEEAYNTIPYVSKIISEIYGYYVNGDISKISTDTIKKYFCEYYSMNNFTLEEIEVTKVIAAFYGRTENVIVVQVQPGVGFNLDKERKYELYGYEFIFENDYYDLDIIDLKTNRILNLNSCELGVISMVSVEKLHDLVSKKK